MGEILFSTRPSLRRAFCFALIYAGVVLYGRIQTELDPRFNPLWWVCFGLLALILVIAVLRKWTTTYIITEDEVLCRSGILTRHIVTVPLVRITNASARQSFLERLLGLVNLQIDCAGGDTSEITFARILTNHSTEAANLLRKMRKGSSTTEQSLD